MFCLIIHLSHIYEFNRLNSQNRRLIWINLNSLSRHITREDYLFYPSGENSDKSTQTRWIKFGGIIRKETSSIIKGPENEEDDEIKTYCPKCCSVMKTWFLKMRKQSKSLTYCNVMIVVKYLLFIIHLPFLELLEFTLESASDYSLPELFI